MILSYVLLLWALCYNLRFRSIRLMVVGTALNFIAIVANGGLMPVSPEVRELAGMTYMAPSQFGTVLREGSGIFLPLDQTNLWFLTDIIPAGQLGGAYSPGDVIIAFGFVLFLVEVLTGNRRLACSDTMIDSQDDVPGNVNAVGQETSGQLIRK